ncbi:MAG: trigger factor, partial [Candidatus Wallbacteria bacterium]|nr:trigger factor [Candidatus Wallbacteria bacterium]
MELAEKEHNLKSGKTVWEFQASAEEVQRALEDVFREASKSLHIPGFRKGKVPRKILESKVGKEYFQEEAKKKIIENGFNRFLEKKIPHIGEDLEPGEFSENGFSFKIITFHVPEFAPEDYSHLSAEKVRVLVDESQVDQTIQSLRQRMAVIQDAGDRPAAADDVAIIDFEGSIQGRKFPGGSESGFRLKLGSKTLLPELESGIAGMKSGETRDITATFPGDYRAKNLAGKEASFKVTLKELKTEVLPDPDDDFAKDMHYENFADMKAKIRERFERMREEEADNRVAGSLLQTIADRVGISVP